MSGSAYVRPFNYDVVLDRLYEKYLLVGDVVRVADASHCYRSAYVCLSTTMSFWTAYTKNTFWLVLS
jgi:hypothetical protein